MEGEKAAAPPLVGLVMGSKSDYKVLVHAREILVRAEVPHETRVVSAHRTPELMFEYGKSAADRGLKVLIAGAGGAAHLPGMLASLTALPVLGVPVPGSNLSGLDSLLSIVQMPGGVPTATFAVGNAGAVNAALFAIKILALDDKRLAAFLATERQRRADEAIASSSQLLDYESGKPVL